MNNCFIMESFSTFQEVINDLSLKLFNIRSTVTSNHATVLKMIPPKQDIYFASISQVVC